MSRGLLSVSFFQVKCTKRSTIIFEARSVICVCEYPEDLLSFSNWGCYTTIYILISHLADESTMFAIGRVCICCCKVTVVRTGEHATSESERVNTYFIVITMIFPEETCMAETCSLQKILKGHKI